jgi:hypothetical protein
MSGQHKGHPEMQGKDGNASKAFTDAMAIRTISGEASTQDRCL